MSDRSIFGVFNLAYGGYTTTTMTSSSSTDDDAGFKVLALRLRVLALPLDA